MLSMSAPRMTLVEIVPVGRIDDWPGNIANRQTSGRLEVGCQPKAEGSKPKITAVVSHRSYRCCLHVVTIYSRAETWALEIAVPKSVISKPQDQYNSSTRRVPYHSFPTLSVTGLCWMQTRDWSSRILSGCSKRHFILNTPTWVHLSSTACAW
jgi:hypothetical protein